MNPKLPYSKKEIQLLRNLKQSTKRAVWISSSFIFLSAFGLVFYFNVADVDNMFAASAENNQSDLPGDSSSDDPASQKQTCADKCQLPDDKKDPLGKRNDMTTSGTHSLPSKEKQEIQSVELKKESDGSTNFENTESKEPLKRINGKLSNNELMELKIVSSGPNPFKDRLRLTFQQQVDFDVDFEIINSSGQAVFIDVINAHKGMNQYEFNDREGLPPGTYYLTLLYNHKKQVIKLIKD